MLNRLRIIAVILTAAIFMLINLVYSLTHNVCAECCSIVYIVLFLYSSVWLAIYLVYPHIKSVLNLKQLTIKQIVFTIILITLIVVFAFATDTYSVLWLLIFSLFPTVKLIFMVTLRKRSWFIC